MEVVTMPKGAIELQRNVQKLEKLEKMINPNSKKSLILWEEDDSFKSLISSIVEYASNCEIGDEFPIELLEKIKALKYDVISQIESGAIRVEELNKQAQRNVELSHILSSLYISAMAGNPVEEWAEKLQEDEAISSMREYLEIISTSVPETDEYIKAEKIIKSKISNLENSVHITIDLERMTSKAGALEYIKNEISPAVDRLQAAYDSIYATTEIPEDAEMALAIRKPFSEKVYDAIVRPIASFFKFIRKSKAK